jgi:hypothetical protein
MRSGGGLLQQARQQPPEAVGIALHHGRLGITAAQQPAEGRIELDQHQTRRIDALRHQRFGDRAGARPELDDRPGTRRIDVARHRARQRLARGRDRAGGQRLLHPGADEADFVVEADALLLFEAAEAGLELLLVGVELRLEAAAMILELLLDLALERALLALENLDVPPDLAPKRARLQLEDALLLFELALDDEEGWKRHLGLTLHDDYKFVTFHR